jgi:hypothetical protein
MSDYEDDQRNNRSDVNNDGKILPFVARSIQPDPFSGTDKILEHQKRSIDCETAANTREKARQVRKEGLLNHHDFEMKRLNLLEKIVDAICNTIGPLSSETASLGNVRVHILSEIGVHNIDLLLNCAGVSDLAGFDDDIPF